MNDERWTIVDRVLDGALARDPHERAAFLDEACAGDEALRREVESLLAHEREAAGFMSRPAGAPADGSMSHGTSMIGRQFGPYAIRAHLGAGGMGEVYRARDTTLGREVAIKILPRLFTTDPERRARFDREARLLASLNHPHIGAIYGVEDVDGTPALILELIEGDTLAERIAKGPISIGEVLNIARQIADALEAAHEKGIIHRDLKPANIKITSDGVVKVLDFGLAKAASGDGSGPDLTQSPTVTIGGTREGVILGTAAYMSPEQARGKPVDKRTDIWAFGCVMYETLTGRAAFAGETLSDTLVAILEREPNWQTLPSAMPHKVRDLLRRCLQKDPHRRLRDIGDARLEIDDAIGAPTSADVLATPVRNTRERLSWVAALVTAIAAAAAGTAWSLRRPQVPANEVRFEINVPPTRDLRSVAISPDGKALVFVATSEGKSRLWLRPLDGVSARPLAGTEDARLPFWSADSQSVGFFGDGKLMRLDIDGGTLLPLADLSGGAGGAWNHGGTILFSVAGSPILRISDKGGDPVPATDDKDNPGFPRFLPDERHFLYSVSGPDPGIFVGQLDRGEPRRLVKAIYAEYLSAGYLVFLRDRTLFAQRFDPAALELTGSPLQVAEHVTAFSTALEGSLVYRSGPEQGSQLVWFDRSGKEVKRVSGAGATPSISPDGSRVAVMRAAGPTGRGQDIWLLDLARDVFNRLTSFPTANNSPVWSPDGQRIAFSSPRDNRPFALYETPVAGGSDRLLLQTDQTMISNDWSPDGKFLIYRSTDPKTKFDLWVLSLGDLKGSPLLQTDFDEREAQFSPDGRWFAYQSNESGRFEIYIRDFPAARTKYGPVSTNGGTQVRWSRDGRELFYVGLDNRMMAVPIHGSSNGQQIEARGPTPLFQAFLSPQGVGIQQYAVSHDGTRFLLNTTEEVTAPVTVVLNWKPKP